MSARQPARWSGVTRAVDEHVAAWKRAKAGIDAVAHLPLPFNEVPVALQHWVTFARSFARTGVVDAATGSNQNDERVDLAAAGNVTRAVQIGHNEFRLLEDGVTHYVSAEMVDVVSGAADLAEPEPLFATDLPCPTGLAVLEQPLLLADLHPYTGVIDPRIVLPIRAIGWVFNPAIHSLSGETGPGITLIAYTDMDAYHTVYMPSLADIGMPEASAADYAIQSGLWLVEFNPWRFGSGWGDGGPSAIDANDVSDPNAIKVVSTVAYLRRWLLSLLRLMWQQIIVSDPGRIDRPTLRRMERAGMDRSRRDDFKVLRLRRVSRPHDDPASGHRLEHRVIVRGHWRQQYYPSLGPVGDLGSYRRIFIDPYIKGPDDAPLVVKHAVTAVVR